MSNFRDILSEKISLFRAADVDTPRLDAALLLAHLLGKNRAWLWAHLDDTMSTILQEEFDALSTRRAAREPLAYLLGEWEFYTRPFYVNSAVLIPRPETELLVEEALKWIHLQPVQQQRTIVDVGTGSGAIAVTMAAEELSLQVIAVDISPASLQVAHRNANRHNVAQRIMFLCGDLLQPVSNPVAAIIANLPYIAEEEYLELMPEVRDYEPVTALCAADDGLALVWRLIKDAPALLLPGGLLGLELGEGQAGKVTQELARQKWNNIHTIVDYAGIDRHVLAERPM